MSTYDPITPTLGDLRRALRDDPPPEGAELSFDLWERDYREPFPGQRLPDQLVVSRAACERVLRGEFDSVPDSTPLEELFA
jgi:hypothetical protein